MSHWSPVKWCDTRGEVLIRHDVTGELITFPVGGLARFGVTVARVSLALSAYRDLHGLSDPAAVAKLKRRKAARRTARVRLRERAKLAEIRERRKADASGSRSTGSSSVYEDVTNGHAEDEEVEDGAV